MTFVVPAAPRGTPYDVELRFSTGNGVGERSPNCTVEYRFTTGGVPDSTRDLYLAKGSG